jgi:hypothetical protein
MFSTSAAWRVCSLFMLSIIPVRPVSAQTGLQEFLNAIKHPWHFEPTPYYDPLAAEPRSAETKVVVGRASSVPFAVNPGQSNMWDISVGLEAPIVGWAFSPVNGKIDTAGKGQPVSAGKLGIGFWFPISFHLNEDLNKDPSAPVLDTDYRFGGMVKVQYGLSPKFGSKSHVGLRYVPIAHESTHVGDEYTIGAIGKYGKKFERVNVSYQYWELGGSFEPNFEVKMGTKTDTLKMVFRGGYIHEAFHKGIGWYDTALLQPIGGTVTPSKRNYEPYAGVEVFFSPDASDNKTHLGPFLSLDYRDRTLYGYDRPSAATSEKVQGTVNVMLGYRQTRGAKIQPSYYLRYYHGVNPAGQFRSQDNYQLYGIGVLFHFE